MVKQLRVRNKLVYQCEACGLGYADQKLARACEDWCRKYRACNIEISNKAIFSPHLELK